MTPSCYVDCVTFSLPEASLSVPTSSSSKLCLASPVRSQKNRLGPNEQNLASQKVKLLRQMLPEPLKLLQSPRRATADPPTRLRTWKSRSGAGKRIAQPFRTPETAASKHKFSVSA